MSEEPIRIWDNPDEWMARAIERDCENFCKPSQNKVYGQGADAPSVHGHDGGSYAV